MPEKGDKELKMARDSAQALTEAQNEIAKAKKISEHQVREIKAAQEKANANTSKTNKTKK